MIIQPSPFVPCTALSLAVKVSGDVRTINDEQLDFSALAEGSELPPGAVRNEFVSGAVTRKNGQISLTLRFPIGSDASNAARFPQPINVTKNGPVEFPQ